MPSYVWRAIRRKKEWHHSKRNFQLSYFTPKGTIPPPLLTGLWKSGGQHSSSPLGGVDSTFQKFSFRHPAFIHQSRELVSGWMLFAVVRTWCGHKICFRRFLLLPAQVKLKIISSRPANRLYVRHLLEGTTSTQRAWLVDDPQILRLPEIYEGQQDRTCDAVSFLFKLPPEKKNSLNDFHDNSPCRICFRRPATKS